MKKVWQIVLSLVLPVAVLLLPVACASGGTAGGGLCVVNMQTAISSVSGNADTQIVSYKITLKNNSDSGMFIQQVEPVVSKSIESRVLVDNLGRSVGNNIASGGTMEVSGKFTFDAKGLSKEDIDKLQPAIIGLRVTAEETLTVPGQPTK